MAKNEKVDLVEDLQTGDEQSTQEGAPEVTNEPKADATIVVNAANGLNLREGPHQTFKVLKTLSDGAPVFIQDLPCGVAVPGWALFSSDDFTCWRVTQFLQTAE